MYLKIEVKSYQIGRKGGKFKLSCINRVNGISETEKFSTNLDPLLDAHFVGYLKDGGKNWMLISRRHTYLDLLTVPFVESRKLRLIFIYGAQDS